MNTEITQEAITAAKKLIAKVNGSKGGQGFKKAYESWSEEKKQEHREKLLAGLKKKKGQ